MQTTRMNRQGGFTLVELIMVMGILAVLAGFFITSYPASQRRARDVQRKSDLKQYQTALESFANKNDGLYPSTLNNPWTLNTLCTALGLTNCPLDPKDNQNICQGNTQCRYYYRSDGSGGPTPDATRYVLYGALEKPKTPGAVEVNFVVCSSGRTQENTTEPTSSSCPS